MSQFFASRGWAVFQMNFRGSTGYGRAFEEAGFKQWGQAMQNDITDGVRYLIAESFADPDRICVVGASYGGYAALMGAVKTPDLYQCAVSIAGVSDVHAIAQWSVQRKDPILRRLFRDCVKAPIGRRGQTPVPAFPAVYRAHGLRQGSLRSFLQEQA